MYEYLFLLFVFITTTTCTEIISQIQTINILNGVQHAIQKLEIECTDTTPFTFTVTRTDNPTITDTIIINCGQPVYECTSELNELIPLSTIVAVDTTLIGNNANEMNQTLNKYFTRIIKEQSQNTAQTIEPIPNSGRTLLSYSNGLNGELSDDDPTDNQFTGAGIVDFPASAQEIQNIHSIEDLTLSIGLFISGGGLFALPTIFFDAIGSDPITLILKDIKALATDVETLFGKVLSIEKNQLRIDNALQLQNTITQWQLAALHSEVVNEQNEVNSLQKNINALFRLENATIQSVNKKFGKLEKQIVDAFSGEIAFKEAILQLKDSADKRFGAVYTSLQRFQAVIVSMRNYIGLLQEKKTTRRELNRRYSEILYRFYNSFALGQYQPFAQDTGIRRKTFQQIQTFQNPQNAVVVGTILFQGTQIASNSRFYAREDEISLLCDPTFVANNSVQTVTLDLFFQTLGPTGCMDTVTPWSCNCIFRVNSSRLLYPSTVGTDFPYDFNEPAVSLIETDRTYQIFDVSASSILGMSGGTNFNYFTSLQDLYSYLQGPDFCAPFIWKNDKVRVVAKHLFRYIGVSVNPIGTVFNGSITQMCESEYSALDQAVYSNITTLANSFYTLLNRETAGLFPSLSRQAEADMYGVLGNAYIEEEIGSVLPTAINADSTVKMSVAGLLTATSPTTGQPFVRTLPVFKFDKSSLSFPVTVQVNSQPVLSSVTIPFTVPMNESRVGNFSIIHSSANIVANIPTLPDSFKWIGTETKYRDDPRFWRSIPTFEPLLWPDFHFEDLSMNSPTSKSREGKLDYLSLSKRDYNNEFQSGRVFGEGLEFNVSVWSLLRNNIAPNPRAATATPSEHLREVISGSHTCGRKLNPVTMGFQTISAEDDRDMCRTRRKFVITPFMMDPDTMTSVTFAAREFTYRLSIEVPVGQISQTNTFQCPDNVLIVPQGTTSYLFITDSNQAVPLTLKYSICSSVSDCAVFGLTFTTPFQTTFPIFQNVKYFLQIWNPLQNTPTSDNRCFYQNNGLGLSIYVSQNYSLISDSDSNIENKVQQISRATIGDYVTLLTAISLSQQAVQQTGIDPTYTQSIQQILANVIANITAIDVSDDPALDQLLQQTADILNQNNKYIDGNRSANAVTDQQYANFTKLALDNLNLTQQLINLQAQKIDSFEDSLSQFKTIVDNFKVNGGWLDGLGFGSGGCGGLPIIGSIICGLSVLFKWIEMLAIIGLIVLAVVYCGPVVMKMCPSFSSSNKKNTNNDDNNNQNNNNQNNNNQNNNNQNNNNQNNNNNNNNNVNKTTSSCHKTQHDWNFNY